MPLFLEICASFGGLVALITAVWVITRAIFRQVHTTEENTVQLGQLQGEITKLRTTINTHGERIARIEGRNPP